MQTLWAGEYLSHPLSTFAKQVWAGAPSPTLQINTGQLRDFRPDSVSVGAWLASERASKTDKLAVDRPLHSSAMPSPSGHVCP